MGLNTWVACPSPPSAQPRPFTICQNPEEGSLPIVLGRTLRFWLAFMRSTLKKILRPHGPGCLGAPPRGVNMCCVFTEPSGSQRIQGRPLLPGSCTWCFSICLNTAPRWAPQLPAPFPRCGCGGVAQCQSPLPGGSYCPLQLPALPAMSPVNRRVACSLALWPGVD